MSYTACLTALQGKLAAVSGLSSGTVLKYTPTALHTTPIMWLLIDGFANDAGVDSMDEEETEYRILARLAVAWSDNEGAELQLIPFIDSVQVAIDADPTLGLSGDVDARVESGDGGWVDIAGVTYRIMDFMITVSDTV